jgi:hypothetical protein
VPNAVGVDTLIGRGAGACCDPERIRVHADELLHHLQLSQDRRGGHPEVLDVDAGPERYKWPKGGPLSGIQSGGGTYGPSLVRSTHGARTDRCGGSGLRPSPRSSRGRSAREFFRDPRRLSTEPARSKTGPMRARRGSIRLSLAFLRRGRRAHGDVRSRPSCRSEDRPAVVAPSWRAALARRGRRAAVNLVYADRAWGWGQPGDRHGIRSSHPCASRRGTRHLAPARAGTGKASSAGATPCCSNHASKCACIAVISNSGTRPRRLAQT